MTAKSYTALMLQPAARVVWTDGDIFCAAVVDAYAAHRRKRHSRVERVGLDLYKVPVRKIWGCTATTLTIYWPEESPHVGDAPRITVSA